MENAISFRREVPCHLIKRFFVSSFLTFFSKFFNFRLVRKLAISFCILININPSSTAICTVDTNEMRVWIDFIEEGDFIFVKGLAISIKENADQYNWVMDIHKENVQKHTDKKLKGEYTAEPYYPHIISETEINLKKYQYFVITLKVFNSQQQFLGSDTLFSTEVNPQYVCPPAPPKPIVKNIAPNSQPNKNKNQNKNPNQNQNLDALEIDGLILDETRSKIARDFYELFYNNWVPPYGVKDFLITIRELPGRGLGATVSIEVNSNVVLNRSLMPRGGVVEEEVGISIAYLSNYLRNLEKLKKDLNESDSQGNGIF